jgi:hypothetical protein
LKKVKLKLNDVYKFINISYILAGSHRERDGTKTSNNTWHTSATKNGHTPLYNFPIGISTVFDTAKRFSPKGGVIIPISITRTIITPHQMGSSPKLVIIGKIIGMVNSKAAKISKKHPINI